MRSASRDKDRFRDKDNKERLEAILESCESPRVRIDKDKEKEKEAGEGVGGAEEKKIWGDEDTEPTEAIVRVLWGDFKAQTKRKIDEVMAFGIVCSLPLSFCILLCPNFLLGREVPTI